MPATISNKLAKRLRTEEIIWLTTVRADGTPQPTPVWFLWKEGEFLIYSKPDALKIRNISRNPRVALNFNTDKAGGSVVVITGEALVDAGAPPATRVPAYIDKYRQGIADLGMTAEAMASEYSTTLRVKPTRIREES